MINIRYRCPCTSFSSTHTQSASLQVNYSLTDFLCSPPIVRAAPSCAAKERVAINLSIMHHALCAGNHDIAQRPFRIHAASFRCGHAVQTTKALLPTRPGGQPGGRQAEGPGGRGPCGSTRPCVPCVRHIMHLAWHLAPDGGADGQAVSMPGAPGSYQQHPGPA